MSEVTPPPPPPGFPPSSTAGQLKVAIPNPPEAMIRELALGAKLDAVIAGAAAKGQFQLDTTFGRVAIQTGVALPSEGSLQLQLLAKGGILQFLITSIHGLPPKAALRALTRPGTAAGKAGAGAKTPTPSGTPGSIQGSAPNISAAGVTRLPPGVDLNVGATLAATLLKGAAPAGAKTPTPGIPGQAPAPTPGQATPAPGISAKGGHQGVPQGTDKAGQTSAKGQPPAPGTPTPRISSGPTPATGQTGGGLLSIRITAFQPAPTTTAGAAITPLPEPPAGGPLTPGGILTGIATGTKSPTGHPIIQTHAGPVVLATRTPLPAGSTITFEVLSQAPTVTTGAAPSHDLRLPPIMAERWPALREAVNTLAEVNPPAAQQLVNAILPRPGAALGGNLVFFLMALSGGNLHGWFGDGPTRALQRAKPELLARLRDDFTQIERIAREPGAGEWRTTLIPLLNGAEIDPIRLSLRGAGEGDGKDDSGDNGTRFIIDMDLSRLGRFQLDGLVHQGEKRMDLIVRTDANLSRPVENGIRDIFQDAADATGIKGGIVFQAAPPNFIEVLGPDPVDETLGLIV